jgi:Acyl-CoA reductase (LuxC)
MDLEDRIEAIATAAGHFPWLGDLRAPTISGWIELELGQALNSTQPQAYGKQKYLISPLSPILHIVSGNTPHAALQSLIRGILIGATNWIKLPEVGLPEVEAFVDTLPEELRPDLASKVGPNWMEQAEAVVVFGSDETIRDISRQIMPSQRFVVHGHKISLGLISAECSSELAGRIVHDLFTFDQLGCLSPQLFYVTGDSIRFARELAQHFEQTRSARIQAEPRHTVAAALRAFREEWKFRAATEPEICFWESRETLEWAVVHDPSPGLAPNPLYGTIFIKPMPSDLPSALLPIRRHIATVGLDPIDSESLKLAVGIGAQRVCAVGRMQSPPVTWHHDGQPTLANLVRYVDIEGVVI